MILMQISRVQTVIYKSYYEKYYLLIHTCKSPCCKARSPLCVKHVMLSTQTNSIVFLLGLNHGKLGSALYLFVFSLKRVCFELAALITLEKARCWSACWQGVCVCVAYWFPFVRCFKNEVVVGFWEHVRARVLVVPRDATLSLFFCSTSAKLAHDYFPLISGPGHEYFFQNFFRILTKIFEFSFYFLSLFIMFVTAYVTVVTRLWLVTLTWLTPKLTPNLHQARRQRQWWWQVDNRGNKHNKKHNKNEYGDDEGWRAGEEVRVRDASASRSLGTSFFSFFTYYTNVFTRIH